MSAIGSERVRTPLVTPSWALVPQAGESLIRRRAWIARQRHDGRQDP
jgi:hypothetical protein